MSTARPEPVRGRPRSALADAAIVQATLELLMEETYSGVTMAGVAARAGVSTATLYRRYQNKDDLVLDVLVRRVDDRTYPDTGTLAGDLHQLLSLIVGSLEHEGGRILRGLIGETMRNPALAARLREQLETPHEGQVRLLLGRAVERGEVPEPADLPAATNLIVGPLYHRFLLTGEPLTAGLVDALLPMLLRALGADAGSA